MSLFYSGDRGSWMLGVESLVRYMEEYDYLELLVFSVMCVVSLITLVSSISSTFPSWTWGGEEIAFWRRSPMVLNHTLLIFH